MAIRAYGLTSATIFGIFAAAHLTRLVTGWSLVVADRTVPHWVSGPGFVLASALCAWGVVAARRSRPA
jgi:hypothetical protein